MKSNYKGVTVAGSHFVMMVNAWLKIVQLWQENG